MIPGSMSMFNDKQPADDREPHRNPLLRLLEPTWQRRRPLQETLAKLGEGTRICDVGAGGRRVRPDAVCVDVEAGPDVDVVADAHALPFEDGVFDLVICTGTLNLCRDPGQVISEFHRILAPGGMLHLEVGMFQPYNPEPEDYWRWTIAGLELLHQEAGFTRIDSGTHIGPVSALVTSALFLSGHVMAGRSLVKRAGRALSHVVLGPMKYFDRLLPDASLARVPFGYGIFYVGRKQ